MPTPTPKSPAELEWRRSGAWMLDGGLFLIDSIGLWIDNRTGIGCPLRRGRRLRKRLRALGLSPSALYGPWKSSAVAPQGSPCGLKVSIAPLWLTPLDLHARAHGDDPLDLVAFIEAASAASARVTYLEIALDMTGMPALAAHDLWSEQPFWVLRGKTRKPGIKDFQGTYWAMARTMNAGAEAHATWLYIAINHVKRMERPAPVYFTSNSVSEGHTSLRYSIEKESRASRISSDPKGN